MKVAVIGATGLVGSKMLQILEERQFAVTQLLPVASEKSVGKTIVFKNTSLPIVSAQYALEQKPQIAIFSAGSSISKDLAPKFAAIGCYVIDNSSCWRMDTAVPLIVPEVNGHALQKNAFIIANPNCSTIQLVVALKPLHIKYHITRVIVSTYQSVTGTGVSAVTQLMEERLGKATNPVYPYPIDLNVIPHIDVFLENGYTKEEMKMVLETKKIMEDDSIAVSATCVRIPTMGGHSESVNIAFKKPFILKQVIADLQNASGIELQDNTELNLYPMPLTAHDKDSVFVGRIRRDETIENGLNLWIVADNLRKGAATNAVQIAELLVKNNWV